ncbi:YjgF family translation initiation inhibitor, partial [Acinetobacter baumannii]
MRLDTHLNFIKRLSSMNKEIFKIINPSTLYDPTPNA